MKSTFLGLFVLSTVFSVDAGSSISRSNTAESTRLRLHQGELEHGAALAALRSNMTLASALQILRDKVEVRPEILTLVEQALDKTKARAKRLSLSLRAGSNPTGYSGKLHRILSTAIFMEFY